VPWWWHFVAQLTILTIAALVFAQLVRLHCIDPGPPVDQPEPGTPLAGYCGAIHGEAPWLLLVVAPIAVLVGCVGLIRRWPRLGWLLMLGLIVALALNQVYADGLDWSHTI
jgi:hypothetical protein